MITLKTGVPGSGKTLSMVAELVKFSQVKDGELPRPLYTNITGLTIPHVLLTDCTKWRECPPGSLVVIDEAFLCGYEAKSAQAPVPDYVRDLAVHRKDYSLDLWFIAQHPKLLAVALRRQVGKHQHYRRLFGWGQAVCYEWDQCQENLAATKTAVMTRFTYPKNIFQYYKSAELHTKPAFQKPWYVWLPVVIIPAALWAFPSAYTTLHDSMSGQGLGHLKIPAAGASAPVPVKYVVAEVKPVQAASSAPLVAAPSDFSQNAPTPVFAGCIRSAEFCKCLDVAGVVLDLPADRCAVVSGASRAPAINIGPDTPSLLDHVAVGDYDTLRWLVGQRKGSDKLPRGDGR